MVLCQRLLDPLADDAVACTVFAEGLQHGFDGVFFIPAVVVWECDDVTRGVGQSEVAGAGKAGSIKAKVRDVEPAGLTFVNKSKQAVIGVLVNHQQFEAPVRLGDQTADQDTNIVGSTQSGKDERGFHGRRVVLSPALATARRVRTK